MAGGGGGGGHGSGEMDFDLNLAPIIDCFTVLITFMLVSAAFIQVSVLEASTAPLSVETVVENPEPPKGVSVALELRENGELALKLTGEETREETIPSPGKGWDEARMAVILQAVKAKWPETKTVTISAQGSVEYEHLIAMMEKARETFPGIQLGGF